MTTTARELITEAYYISGALSQEQQESGGTELKNGLNALNRALAVESITGTLIPFFKEYEFDFVPGQEKYEIDNLIEIENVTYILSNVRYQMRRLSRNDYFSQWRVEGITSPVPTTYHFERRKGGGDIYFYFPPSSSNTVKVWGKFGLTKIADENVDLETIYSDEYITYLGFLAAKYICIAYDETLPEQAQQVFNEIVEGLHYQSKMDLTVRKTSVFGKKYLLDPVSANLYDGWWP